MEEKGIKLILLMGVANFVFNCYLQLYTPIFADLAYNKLNVS